MPEDQSTEGNHSCLGLLGDLPKSTSDLHHSDALTNPQWLSLSRGQKPNSLELVLQNPAHLFQLPPKSSQPEELTSWPFPGMPLFNSAESPSFPT